MKKRTPRDSLINEPRTDIDAGLDEHGVKRARPTWPKRKVALMMGYSGTGYQGMQL